MKKRNKNLFERTFDSIFRCILKIVAGLLIVSVVYIGLIGSEVSYSFKLNRVKVVAEKQLNWLEKVVGGVNIFRKVAGIF